MFEGIPISQCSSTVSECGLVKKPSHDEWQEDDINSVGVIREKLKINTNEICNINALDPFQTGYVNCYKYNFFSF